MALGGPLKLSLCVKIFVWGWYNVMMTVCNENGDRCVVPECDASVEFTSPAHWCKSHWEMWWGWPAGEPEPMWMPGVVDVCDITEVHSDA